MTSPYFEPPPPPARATGWNGTDLLILTSLVVLLVALFMPWFSGSVHLSNRVSTTGGGADGPRAHGYLWFVFALAIIALVVLVARDVISRVPGDLPTPEQMLMVATGLALLLTILGAVVRPSPAITVVSPTGSLAPFPVTIAVSIGWSYGGFVAIAAAAVAFVAAFRQAGPLRSGGGALRMPSRSPGAPA
jgi:hypothetical protein